MNPNDSDKRLLCRSALEGLKSFRIKKLIIPFLDKQGLSVDKNLSDMYARVKRWMGRKADRCEALWEYVDYLRRRWGRQRIFLYEVDEDYAIELSNEENVKKKIGNVFDKPLFKWEADKPFLAGVKYAEADGSGTSLLIFKFVENRKYIPTGQIKEFIERSTNFFVVNLKNHHAELRIQNLPTGAVKDIRQELLQLQSVIREYLDFKRMHPIDLVPIMDYLLRNPTYTIKASKLNFDKPDSAPDAPLIVAFLNKFHRKAVPAELIAFYDCKQDIFGEKHLHFKCSGNSDYVEFDGIADPDRIDDILMKFVELNRKPKNIEIKMMMLYF